MQVKIEKNKIRLLFPHDKKMVAICHHLSMYFSKVKKDWSFDDNLMNRQCIERLFPGSFPQELSKEKELAVPDFLMDHQKRVLAICAKRDRFGIFHDTGCHAKGTKILMASGRTKNVEDVLVGDFLMGESGFRKVLSLHRGTETMYRIVPVKGEPFVVNGAHILSLKIIKQKNVLVSFGENSKWQSTYKHHIINISVKDYINKSKGYQKNSWLRQAPVQEFCNAGGKELIIKPYHLGIFLGDGSLRYTPTVHNRHEAIITEVKKIADQFGTKIRTEKRKGTRGLSHFLTTGIKAGGKGKNLLSNEIKRLNLKVHCRDKFIPFQYKTASFENRLELIAGLIDTDGYLGTDNNYQYGTVSKKLANDMTFACRSVGLSVSHSITVTKSIPYYRLYISGDTHRIPCRREKRKANLSKRKKSPLVTGFTIEKLSENNYYGFSLDGDHLYLDGNFTVHHNTGKTITALEIYKHHKVKTLVVCPLSLIDGAWLGEIHSRYHGIDASNLWAARKKSPAAFNRALEKDLCLINYESFRTIDKKLASANFEMIFLDESARIKSPKSSTSKKIIDFCDNMKYAYLLSGVPAPNGEYDYWTQIRILDPLLWDRSSYKFRKRFFYDGTYGGCGEIRSEYVQKIKDDVATVAEYVNKADVLDLPERTDSMRIFQLSSEEQKHYKNIKNHLVTMLSEGETIESPNAVTAIMKLRQLSSGILLEKVLDCENTAKKLKYKTIVHKIGESKLKEYMQLIEDIGNKQIVTWIQFKAEAQIIKEELAKIGKKGEILNSTATEAEKQKYLEDFKSGKLQYIICHPKSVGYGHTLTNCSESVYYSCGYSYDDDYQSRDRIYRYGQKNKCSYYYLIADKTMDKPIMDAVHRKEKISMAILNYLKEKK